MTFQLDLVVVAIITTVGSILVALLNKQRKNLERTVSDAEFLRNQLTPTNGHRISESIEQMHDDIKELRRYVEEELRFHRAFEHRGPS